METSRLALTLAAVALSGCAAALGGGDGRPPAALRDEAVGRAKGAPAFALAAGPAGDALPGALLTESGPALPPSTYREPMPRALGADAPAVGYAELSPAACKAEVARRGLPVAAVKSTQRGVASGMRLTGPMNGVRLVTPPPSTKFGVLDCRLALVLDDLTERLADLGVVGVRIDNMYRPNAKLPGKAKASQHAHGLALDVDWFELADGRRLDTRAWGATIGQVPCGPEAVATAPTAESVDVRNLVCAIGRTGLFHTLLTPSFDAAHQSHFHFDIKAGSSHTAVR